MNDLSTLAQQGNVEAQYRLGAEYYHYQHNQNYSRFWLELAAHNGHVEAQYLLGRSYGWQPAQDMERAKYWLERAIDQGYVEAQGFLRYLYAEYPSPQDSYPVPEYTQVDLEQLTMLAEQGIVEYQYMLGREYISRLYGIQAYNKGLKWLETAANKGHIDAQYRLGMVYYRSDVNKSEYWLNQAAQNGHHEAAKYHRLLKSLMLSLENSHPRKKN